MNETTEHCLTVLSCMISESNDYQDEYNYKGSKRKWEEAIKYLEDFIEEKVDLEVIKDKELLNK